MVEKKGEPETTEVTPKPKPNFNAATTNFYENPNTSRSKNRLQMVTTRIRNNLVRNGDNPNRSPTFTFEADRMKLVRKIVPATS
jgi:hypothetical protein